jgi:hypothetical protein
MTDILSSLPGLAEVGLGILGRREWMIHAFLAILFVSGAWRQRMPLSP